MNIYVGNLSVQVTGEELRRAFMTFGEVTSVAIMSGKNTGNCRGHGFVEMPSYAEGEAAIDAMNKAILSGREIDVIEALPLSHKAGRPALYDGSYGDKPRIRSGSRTKRQM